MDKTFSTCVRIEDLHGGCSTLGTELKLLNQDLRSLGGREEDTSVQDSTEVNIQSDLKEMPDIGKVLNHGLKRRASSTDSSATDRTETQTLSARLSSIVVKPDPEQDLGSEAKRRALLHSQRDDKRVLDRNKRMFGMLLGTLESFKTEETDRERLAIKRIKIEKKWDMAIEDSAKRIEWLLEKKRKKEEILDKTLLKFDYVSRHVNWQNTYKHLSKFIQTESKPKLFWLPKEHTQLTEKRLKETRDYFSLYAAEKSARLRKDLADLESNDKKDPLNHVSTEKTQKS